MKRHDSQRGWFGFELYKKMAEDPNIWLIVGDLGWGVFDAHFEDFPERCINTGAAEVSMVCIAVGLALEGKIPFVYSITTFLLYRPFETIRTYINHEQLNVKLIGSGRDKDYEHDGISHWSEDAYMLFTPYNKDPKYTPKGILDNIHAFWPENKEEIPDIVDNMCKSGKPEFLSLRR